MKTHPHGFKSFFTVILSVLAVTAWLLFAPIQFGGQIVYVIISGNSMEPGFYRGDLVLLRKSSDYQIGDIATYHHPDIGLVIHRIIGRERNRFIFKGDNNSWIDPYQPDSGEVIGKFWLHLPTAGKYLEALRTPWGMILLTATCGVMVVVTGVVPFQWRQSHRHVRKSSKEKIQLIRYLANNKTDLFSVLATLALTLLILAFFAFNRPLSRTELVDLTYEQTGVFNYTAPVPSGIYNSDRVQTGEPIFRRLVNIVTVNFDYQQAVSGLPSNLAPGIYRFVAEISHENGWKRTIELQPETPFEGSAFNTSVNVDLSQIQAIIDHLEQQTGITGQQYTLAIGPDITINGLLAGQPLQDKFSPRLAFNLNKTQMRLLSDTVLNPSQEGTTQQERTVPNTLAFLGFQIEVFTARRIALGSLAFCLAVTLALKLLIFAAGPSRAASRLPSKYNSLLISVRNTDMGTTGRLVEVASLDDLAKIAERDGRMILHQAQGSTHHYFVTDGSVTYGYRLVEQSGKQPVQIMKARPL